LADAPLFLHDSNKELHQSFTEISKEVSNPYNSIMLWTRAQALDLEAINENI